MTQDPACATGSKSPAVLGKMEGVADTFSKLSEKSNEPVVRLRMVRDRAESAPISMPIAKHPTTKRVACLCIFFYCLCSLSGEMRGPCPHEDATIAEVFQAAALP
jgi:hypothetical protein